MLRLVFVLLLAVAVSGAGWEHYVVEQPDGTLASVGYNPNNENGVSLEESLENLGLGGLPYHAVDPAEVPSEDVDLLKLNNGKVVVDAAKKQAKIDTAAAKAAKRAAVLAKLKITEDELKGLL